MVTQTMSAVADGLKTILEFTSEILANEKSESWVQLCPYGRFDNSQGMQEIRKQDAEECVRNFGRMANAGTRAMGLPFYVGHPYHPSFQGKAGHTDNKSYGRIKALEAREDGLFANVKWNAAGRELINGEAFHGHSVEWDMLRDPRQSGLFHPVNVVSVGFTNRPNIPVSPITSANESMNFKELAKALGLPETATEADIIKAANEAQAARTSFQAVSAALEKAKVKTVEELAGQLTAANEKLTEANTKVVNLTNDLTAANTKATEATTALTAANEKVTNLTTQVSTLTGERDTVRSNFANERSAHRKVLIDRAVAKGQITGAEVDAWQSKLAKDETFANEADALGKLTAKYRTNSMVTDAGQRQSATHDRIGKVTTLCNETMEKLKCSYDDAFTIVKRDNPSLFASMIQPEK